LGKENARRGLDYRSGRVSIAETNRLRSQVLRQNDWQFTVEDFERRNGAEYSGKGYFREKECFSKSLFKIVEVKEDSSEFIFTYNCAKDTFSLNGEAVSGWATFAHHGGKIFRKVEKDWKMCYLAMEEDSTGAAEVEFKFKLPSKQVSSISVTAHSATYENGKVNWVKWCFIFHKFFHIF
jgi:hypothetical protein